MKRITTPLLLFFAVMTLLSCKKDSVSLTPLASLNLVNATVNAGAVKANFTNVSGKGGGQYYSQITTSVNYGSNNVYGVLAGRTIPITVAPADTTQPVFGGNLSLTRGGIYSFYLAGQAGAVDTLLVKESIPHHGDSSCGVRFINLSYNSNPIIITQAATPTVIEFNSLRYKQFSEFKTYAASLAVKSYAFQVRDAGTNALLGSYTLSTPYFQNVTLAWIGQGGGSGLAAPKVIRVNNY